MLLRMTPAKFVRVFVSTVRQLFLAEVTIASVLALAFLMNYSGATATMGLAFAATGALFPFFSALLGWLGVFLTGSDTAANALFGNLQVITAESLKMNPVLMAASNSSGGVMGKMISLQSVAVAAAATAMPSSEEAKLFRFTLRHSILLASPPKSAWRDRRNLLQDFDTIYGHAKLISGVIMNPNKALWEKGRFHGNRCIHASIRAR